MKREVLVLLLAVAGACGGGSDDVDKFKGTWQWASGTATTTCPQFGTSTDQLTGETFTIGAGTSSDLSMTDQGCVLKFDVNGNTASLAGGAQSGTYVTDEGSGTLNVSSYMGTIGATDSMTVSGSATITITISGQSITCSFTLSGTATRTSKG